MVSTIEKTQPQFKQVGTVFVSETLANRNRSMALLKGNSMRALTYQEAFVVLNKNPDLKEQLKGKWFWLAGEGLDPNGYPNGYYSFDEKGELVSGKGSAEQTLYVFSGIRPLSLDVLSDKGIGYGRYSLVTSDLTTSEALAIVGVKTDEQEGTLQNDVFRGQKR